MIAKPIRKKRCCNYWVTIDARVWSFKTKKYLKQWTCNGYKYVTLYKNGKRYSVTVHRLMAQEFLDYREDLDVNHKDENRGNNCLENLEMITHKENMNYGSRAKKVSKPIRCIETGVGYSSIKEASEKLNIQYETLIKALKSNNPVEGGYHWEYIKK